MIDLYDLMDQWDHRGPMPLIGDVDSLDDIPEPTADQLAELDAVIDDEARIAAKELDEALAANGLTQTPEIVAWAIDASTRGGAA